MGYIAKGLYRELLDEAWIEGSIPNDMVELADICDCPIEVMTEAWPRIMTCWHLDGDRWVNEKLESLRTEVDTIRVTKARAGRIGGLTKLKNKLESEQADASKVKQMLADAKHVLEPASGCHIEEEEEEKSKRKRREEISTPTESHPERDSGKPETRPEEYANSWNRLRGPLPKVLEFTESRKRKVVIRQRQGISLEAFEKAVAKCAQDPFLSGDNRQGWKADFDWIVENDKNLLKVLEGKYDKGESNGADKGGERSGGHGSGAAGRVSRTLAASREAAARRRGTGAFSDADGADVGVLPAPGVLSGDGGRVPVRHGATSGEIWPDLGQASAARSASSSGPEILPPSRTSA